MLWQSKRDGGGGACFCRSGCGGASTQEVGCVGGCVLTEQSRDGVGLLAVTILLGNVRA